MQTNNEKIEWRPAGRSARWYEWLLILLLLGFAGGVRAASVHKCEDGHGAVAYQSQPCPAEQHATEIDLGPTPAYAPSPHYLLDAPLVEHAERGPRAERQSSVSSSSWECRAADGRVFYRHTSCPRSLSPAAA